MEEKSNTIKTLKIITSNWKTVVKNSIFDIIFILSMYLLFLVQSLLIPLFQKTLIYLLIILEFVIVILIYSIFKYLILKSFQKIKFNKKEFIIFFKLNLIIFAPIITIVFFIVNFSTIYLINTVQKGGIDPFVFVFSLLGLSILLLIIIIYAYTFVNITHFSFLKQNRISKLIKQNLTRTKPLKYYKDNIKIIIIIGLVLLAFHLAVKFLLFNTFAFYIKYYGKYKTFMTLMMIVSGYFLILYNRFKLYQRYK